MVKRYFYQVTILTVHTYIYIYIHIYKLNIAHIYFFGLYIKNLRKLKRI